MVELNSRQKRNEIRTLSPELGLRDIPGNFVERRRRRDPRITAGVAHALAFIKATGGEVLAVARTPTRLLLRTQLLPALRGTRPLPIAYAWIGSEPSMALTTRPLLRHSPIVIDGRASSKVDCFCRAEQD